MLTWIRSRRRYGNLFGSANSKTVKNQKGERERKKERQRKTY
jgi:hypothetical protein